MGTWVCLLMLSKFLDWIHPHYGMKIRRLLKQSPNQGGKDSRCERRKPEYLVYLHYTSQCASVVFKRISDAFHIHINPIGNSCENQYPKTSPKGFVPRRPFPTLSIFSHWHMGNYVRPVRRRVNQNLKEPFMPPLAEAETYR